MLSLTKHPHLPSPLQKRLEKQLGNSHFTDKDTGLSCGAGEPAGLPNLRAHTGRQDRSQALRAARGTVVGKEWKLVVNEV